MSTKSHTKNLHATQWRMLLIYNIYRLISIAVLFVLFWFNSYHRKNATVFYSSLIIYLMLGLIFLFIWHKRIPKFEQQVLWSGTIDTIVMVLFINALGYLETGLGILLNVSIAVLSILSPGRLAIYFAAIASCMLLVISTAQYLEGTHDVSGFLSTGIYGAGFFATALTAWYLARRVHSSETLAQYRTKELMNMQRLNDYIVARLQYGVIFIDSEMSVQVINLAARQFLHLPENKQKLNLQQLSLPLYDKYLQFLAMRGKDGHAAQAVLEEPLLQVHFFPASYADQTAVLIILEDMTFVAQQAQQLKLASLGRFSASIAHELRNPLGVISHAVQLMSEDKDLNQEDKRLKQLIIKNCQRMDRVIKNVLQMSRRQHSKTEIIDLAPFLKQFKRDFCIIDQCEIHLDLPEDKKKTIVFDKSQLEQILIILCENAIQHGRDKTGQVKITIAVKKKERHLILSICDAGEGVPENIRSNIFDPFFSTQDTGNGMGLFIAKDLCEVNQAQLCLADTEHGACFTIILNHNDEIPL